MNALEYLRLTVRRCSDCNDFFELEELTYIGTSQGLPNWESELNAFFVCPRCLQEISSSFPGNFRTPDEDDVSRILAVRGKSLGDQGLP